MSGPKKAETSSQFASLRKCTDEDLQEGSLRLVRTVTLGSSLGGALSLIRSHVLPDATVTNPSAKDVDAFIRSSPLAAENLCAAPDLQQEHQEMVLLKGSAPLLATEGGRNEYFYSRIPIMMTIGGRDRYVNYTAPHCSSGQALRRVVVRRGDDGEVNDIGAIAATGLLVNDADDPLENEVSMVRGRLQEFGAVGLCRKRVAGNRFGLFWALNKDPYGELALRPAGGAAADRREERALLRKTLPSAIARCLVPSETEASTLEDQMKMIAEKVRANMEANWGPEIRSQAFQVAKSFWVFRELESHEQQFLRDVVAFGLHHGVSEKKISQVAQTVLQEDRDLYRMATVVSLLVAAKMHNRHLPIGGLGERIPEMIPEIISKVMSGAIHVRTKTASEGLVMSTAFAFYNNQNNEIVFPPVSREIPLQMLFSSIVHECMHAYQDSLGVPITVLRAEQEAYAVGFRAEVFLQWQQTQSIDLAPEQTMKMQLDVGKYQMAHIMGDLTCLGMPKVAQLRFQQLIEQSNALGGSWQQSYAEAWLANASPLERKQSYERFETKFYEWYRILNYLTARSNVFLNTLVSSGQNFEQRHAEGGNLANWPHRWNAGLLSQLRPEVATYPATMAGGAAAWNFLATKESLLASAYYMDRPRWEGFIAKEDEFDALADALLTNPCSMDGND